MTSTEVILVLNSILLGLISLTFLVIGYFFKDLHKDFKQMIEKVNNVHNELQTHITLFENLSKLFQRQIDSINSRIKKVEKTVFKNEA